MLPICLAEYYPLPKDFKKVPQLKYFDIDADTDWLVVPRSQRFYIFGSVLHLWVPSFTILLLSLALLAFPKGLFFNPQLKSYEINTDWLAVLRSWLIWYIWIYNRLLLGNIKQIASSHRICPFDVSLITILLLSRNYLYLPE